jgi:hypothetical protein
MAFTLMAKAIQADIPDCHAKWLMVILADHANEYTHECWPSLDRLATRACMNRSTVTRKLNWLEEQGWISRERGNSRRSTLYTIFPTGADSTSTGAECNPKLSVTSQSKNKRSQVPDNWYPDDDLRQSIDSILKENIDHEHEASRFCDHHQSKGNVFADVRKAYRLWCRNSIKYRDASSGGGKATGNRQSGRGRHAPSFFAGIHKQLNSGRANQN